MHSRRMRTARLLTISGSIRMGGLLIYGGLLSYVGVCLHIGGLPAPWLCRKADPLPVDRMIDTSENITLPHTSDAGGKNAKQRSAINLNWMCCPSTHYFGAV